MNKDEYIITERSWVVVRNLPNNGIADETWLTFETRFICQVRWHDLSGKACAHRNVRYCILNWVMTETGDRSRVHQLGT